MNPIEVKQFKFFYILFIVLIQSSSQIANALCTLFELSKKDNNSLCASIEE